MMILHLASIHPSLLFSLKDVGFDEAIVASSHPLRQRNYSMILRPFATWLCSAVLSGESQNHTRVFSQSCRVEMTNDHHALENMSASLGYTYHIGEEREDEQSLIPHQNHAILATVRRQLVWLAVS